MPSVLIRPASLIFAVLLPAAIAQDTGSVEGRVTSSTAHTSLPGAVVTVGSERTTTNASGSFRFTGLTSGEHTISFEAEAFFRYDAKVRVDPAMKGARLDVELTPYSSISGRVLDEEGSGMPGVAVEITEAVRGTGTTWYRWGAVTDAKGRYRIDAMTPGTYLAMARPDAALSPKARDGQRRAWVRTYYPSVPDRGQAARVVLRGGTQAAGSDIRLIAAPVHAIRGMVYDDQGHPASATVSLFPPDWLEKPQAEVKTRAGAFEFAGVPAGEWRVAAETQAAGQKLRGVAPPIFNRKDIDNLVVQLSAPFPLEGSVEPRGVRVENVELVPIDSPVGGDANTGRDEDGALHFRAVYPGRYSVHVFSNTSDHYLDAIQVGDQEVLGKEITLMPGAPPIRIIFKASSAGLSGTVENCATGSILLLPENEELWNFRFIRRAACDISGHFEIRGLRPGAYYVLALERIYSTGLDDVSVLRRLATLRRKNEGCSRRQLARPASERC